MLLWRLCLVALAAGSSVGRRAPKATPRLQLRCHPEGRAPAGPLTAVAAGSDSSLAKSLQLLRSGEALLRLDLTFPADLKLPLPTAHALRLQGSVNVKNPAYVHAFDDDLWLTQFGLRRPGNVLRVRENQEVASLRALRKEAPTWPNSLTKVPAGTFPGTQADGVLVCDGFLAPGASDGAVYFLSDIDADKVHLRRLTARRKGWFYHKAVLLDVLGDGNYSVICARGRKPLFGPGRGELVLLEQPPGWAARGELAGPWKETVLCQGPDVMFDVIDLDPSDGQLEVFAAEFFSKRLSKHVLALNRAGQVRVRRSEVLDDSCGPAYGVLLACMSGEATRDNTRDAPQAQSPFGCIGADLNRRATHVLMTSHEAIYDGVLATPAFASHMFRGNWRHQLGQAHRLGVRVAKALAGRSSRAPVVGSGKKAPGGALYSYQIHDVVGKARTSRKVVASGFRVRGVSINPGAPGFVYSFYPRRRDDPEHGGQNAAGHRPHLLLAGDCAQAAYVLMPREGGAPESYDVLDVIEVDGAVGSLAVCYGDKVERSLLSQKESSVALHHINGRDEHWSGVEGSEDDWARLVVPNYDKGEIHVFRMAPTS